jgi:hypothetical protein
MTGAAIAPYSVAQHSVLGSRQFTNRNLAAWFLLHDGSEAYTNDLSARLKPSFPKFKEMETRILRCLVKKFNLSWPMPAEVKRMDLVMLLTEKRDLMAPEPMDWNLPVLEPLREKIYPWSFVRSKSEFLTRFNELFPRV